MDEAPIVLSSTAFNDAASCLRKFDYRWNQKLVPRPNEVKAVMRRGTYIHRALEMIDHGLPWVPELDEMCAWAIDHEVDPLQVDQIRTEVYDLVTDYIAYWAGHEEDPGPYETVGTEVALDWMPNPTRGIKATLDRIVRDKRGRLWIWERKSTSEIPDAAWRAVDPQTLIQYIVARANGMAIQGIVFDYVLTDPGPAVRVKKDGRFYAGLENKSVTSRAFALAEQEVRANWQTIDSKKRLIDEWSDPGPDAYLNSMRVRMVNDSKFFSRYTVYRPEDSVKETMRDVAEVMHHIEQARRTNHWPRSLNVFSCSRFCQYGKVCITEYVSGRVSEITRQELYIVENPDIRSEGRSSS